MTFEPRDAARAPIGEPWGWRLRLGLVVVVIVTACLDSYGMTTWPMADDEVPSLVEMGLFQLDAGTFSVPANQIGRLPRAMPVWYGLQRQLLLRLPANQFGFRLPAVVFAVLTSALAFALAARWRGLWFATALAILLNGSQLFVLVSQLDRFYALPLLLMTLTLGVIWTPAGGAVMLPVVAALTVLTVLSHNMTVAVFVLGFIAAAGLRVIGRGERHVLYRSGVAALVGVAVYLFYLRPIVSGWASTGNPTPVLVSFAAYAGVQVLSLALFGGLLVISRQKFETALVWWALVFAGSFCVFLLAKVSWNPRYFLFFMPAMWVLAAHAMDVIAGALGRRFVGAAWYGCVVLTLVPSLLSHYQDGSRHDYREAARVLSAHAHDGETILSDDAETISYYLSPGLRAGLQVRTKVRELPPSEFFLVARANVWMPSPRIPDRRSEVLAEISRRRFDQFSHVLRVYHVAAADH